MGNIDSIPICEAEKAEDIDNGLLEDDSISPARDSLKVHLSPFHCFIVFLDSSECCCMLYVVLSICCVYVF